MIFPATLCHFLHFVHWFCPNPIVGQGGNYLFFFRPVRTLGISLVTISDAYPRRGCATETTTVLIILTKINKIAPHPLAHPVISDVQLDVAFQIPSDVMETTIVETVLVRFFLT